MTADTFERLLGAFVAEQERWGGIRNNKDRKQPFELIRFSEEDESPKVMVSFADYNRAIAAAKTAPIEAGLRAVLVVLTKIDEAEALAVIKAAAKR